MTPKEKANELVEKFLNAHEFGGGIGLNEKQAKQCALIVVDEILKAIPMYTGNLNPTWKFYDEVKTEIEKL